MQPLPAGHDLQAAEQQVETVRVLRSARLRMRVEGPLAHRVSGHEQELAPVLPRRPFAQPPLVRRGQVRLATRVLVRVRGEQLLRFREVDLRDL